MLLAWFIMLQPRLHITVEKALFKMADGVESYDDPYDVGVCAIDVIWKQVGELMQLCGGI